MAVGRCDEGEPRVDGSAEAAGSSLAARNLVGVGGRKEEECFTRELETRTEPPRAYADNVAGRSAPWKVDMTACRVWGLQQEAGVRGPSVQCVVCAET